MYCIFYEEPTKQRVCSEKERLGRFSLAKVQLGIKWPSKSLKINLLTSIKDSWKSNFSDKSPNSKKPLPDQGRIISISSMLSSGMNTYALLWKSWTTASLIYVTSFFIQSDKPIIKGSKLSGFLCGLNRFYLAL